MATSQDDAPMSQSQSTHAHSYAVVWTTLPLISLILPTIGHVGITDSSGVIRDFSGPYMVTKGRMMGGPPRRVWNLNLNDISGDNEYYNDGVEKACGIYENRMHNILFDNCHSHVARTLNEIRYEGRDDWNMVRVWWRIWKDGKWVSKRVATQTMTPSVVVGILILLAIILPTVL